MRSAQQLDFARDVRDRRRDSGIVDFRASVDRKPSNLEKIKLAACIDREFHVDRVGAQQRFELRQQSGDRRERRGDRVIMRPQAKERSPDCRRRPRLRCRSGRRNRHS